MTALLLLGLALLELYVFFLVADAIGFLNAVGLAILVSLVGLWLVKRAGLKALRRFQQQAVSTTPEAPAVDGLLLLLAGALLLFPGFVSGALGLLLLVPPVRHLARRLVVRRYGIEGRVVRARFGGRVVDTTATTTTTATTDPRGPIDAVASDDLRRPDGGTDGRGTDGRGELLP